MSPEEPQPPGRLRPVSILMLVALGLVGTAAGWVAHPLLVRWGYVAPVVTWLPSLLFGFAAAILLMTARATKRALDGHRPRPEPHEMVNRFVLARSTAIVGALVAGGYAGYALSWLGMEAERASERVVRSAVASLFAVAMVVGGVLLERACRVRSDDSGA